MRHLTDEEAKIYESWLEKESIPSYPTNNEAKWLDDGDCIICSKCKKAFGSQYIERKNDTVLVPITCPNCHSNMTDIVKA